MTACRRCSVSREDHVSSLVATDGLAICTLRNGLVIRTPTSVPVAPGTDATPDGRGATSRRDRVGTIPAADLLARFDTAYPWWAHYRDQLAALRDAQGKKPQPGRHAARDSLFFVANAEMQAAADGLMGLGVRR